MKRTDRAVLKNDILVDLFTRMIETSRCAKIRHFDANPVYDPTSASEMTVYAHLAYGLIDEQPFVGPLTEDEAFFGFADNPPPPQLLKIHVTSIWGDEITVHDYLTGAPLMHCYFDPQSGWAQRKTVCKPQHTLRRLLFEADFLSQAEADRKKDNWYDADDYGCLSDYE